MRSYKSHKFRPCWLWMHVFICFSAVYFFTLTFPSSWRSICSVSINQAKKWLYKETIKWNSLGIVHDYCDCHKNRILTITCACSRRLSGKIIQISYHLESNICIPLLSVFLSNYPVKKKRNKNQIFFFKYNKKKNKCTARNWTGKFSITSSESYHSTEWQVVVSLLNKE